MSFGHLAHAKPSLEVTVVTGSHSDVVAFTAGGAITAGDVVAFDVAGQTGEDQASTVIQAVADSHAAIGVALEAITAGEATAGASVRVCVSGYIEGVNCLGAAGGFVQGSPAKISGAGAGRVDLNTAASIGPVLGVALDAPAANVVTMYLYRQY